jgi:U3 small nucleolar RNA-associated protein 23
VITTCSIRHLSAKLNTDELRQHKRSVEELAQSLERRRCGHHPDQYEEPVSELDCLRGVVDPKNTLKNKNCYIVASQDKQIRSLMKRIPGVPCIHITRSVMVMDHMSEATAAARTIDEKRKFRAGLKSSAGHKRKREGDDSGDDVKGNVEPEEQMEDGDVAGLVDGTKEKKRKWGAKKGPNPLSVMKKKAKPTAEKMELPTKAAAAKENGDMTANAPPKKKRIRRTKKIDQETGKETAAGVGNGASAES